MPLLTLVNKLSSTLSIGFITLRAGESKTLSLRSDQIEQLNDDIAKAEAAGALSTATASDPNETTAVANAHTTEDELAAAASAAHAGTHQPNGTDVIPTGPGVTAAIGDAGTTGTSNALARADHKHSISAAAAVALDNASASAEGASVAFARADHTHALTDFDGTPTYTVTNLATSRTMDANAATNDQLADVLGTLLADLKAKGLIG